MICGHSEINQSSFWRLRDLKTIVPIFNLKKFDFVKYQGKDYITILIKNHK